MNSDATTLLFLLGVLLVALVSSPFAGAVGVCLAALAVSYMIMKTKLAWACYSTILMYLGGMMVLFLYVCALSDSPKLTFTPQWRSSLLGTSALLGISVSTLKFYSPKSAGEEELTAAAWELSSKLVLWIALGVVLLGLFICVYLCLKGKGPLKFKPK